MRGGSMKIAIMQPYLFPYIGYYQLLKAVDTFVVYDDAQYMKGGWINRNRVLLNGKDHYFTFGVKKDSLYLPINKRFFSPSIAVNGAKFKGLLHSCYRKAPYYHRFCECIDDVLHLEECNIALFIMHSLKIICNYLGLGCSLVFSSEINKNDALKSQDRVIDIVKCMNADHYINAIGGYALYEKPTFEKNNISLNFLKPHLSEYTQLGNPFIPGLSIIDSCMFNNHENMQKLLESYELI
jgi:hypothetical protein